MLQISVKVPTCNRMPQERVQRRCDCTHMSYASNQEIAPFSDWASASSWLCLVKARRRSHSSFTCALTEAGASLSNIEYTWYIYKLLSWCYSNYAYPQCHLLQPIETFLQHRLKVLASTCASALILHG